MTDESDAARLAGSEARLDVSWRDWQDALAAVPAGRLAEPGVCGTWSVVDLMGHVAFWDRHALGRGRAALAGRDHPSVDADPLNARDHAAHAGRSPEQQRIEMETAHADLLAFVATLPADPARRDAVLAAMAVDTDLHYDEHAAEIRAWLTRDEGGDPMAPVEAAWGDLLAATAGLSAEHLAEPGVCGAWSVAAVVGHVGFWVEHTVGEVTRFRPGQPAVAVDWQALNEADEAATADATIEERFARFHHAADRLRSAVRGFAGGAEDRRALAAFVRDDTIPHAAEHAAGIRAWRDRHGI